MDRPRISACVMTLNEEANIRRCLASLTWCDEIVVVDSGSTDRTVEYCKEFTEQVYEHPWAGYIAQRNVCRERATFEWVLFLDADEEVSNELRDNILTELSHRNGKYDGYQFPRKVFYLGRWINHGEWYPDVKLRLFRKEKGHSGGQEPHDMVIVDGPVKTLKGNILHYTYSSIQDHVSTINRFSSISAQQKYDSGRRFRFTDLAIRPGFRFFKALIIKRGFLDGLRGVIIASISSFGVVMKYAKLRELEWIERREKDGNLMTDDLKLEPRRQENLKNYPPKPNPTNSP